MNCKATLAIVLLMLVSVLSQAAPPQDKTPSLSYGKFGKVALYKPAGEPEHVVIFISGDGGWNLGVIDMAKSLTENNTLVVGVDITHYLKTLEKSQEKCVYFAGDLEGLSQYVQRKLGYSRYISPVLAGYSSGATLVYATLVQAPVGTFNGALSLGFCPDLMLRKTVCKGGGLTGVPDKKLGQIFDAVNKVNAPWTVLQGEADQVCNTPSTKTFVDKVNGGEIVLLPKVGHGFSVQRNWMPQFKNAFQKTISQDAPPPSPPHAANLPLIEKPTNNHSKTFAILLTGDGGWAGIDRNMADAFNAAGIPVVGWDSLRYFWKARNAEETARDLEIVIRHYLQAWHSENVLLVGYSFGADAMPVMASRLPENLRKHIRLVALLAPSKKGDLEFHIGDWIGMNSTAGYAVMDEVNRIHDLPVLCIYPKDESDRGLCPELSHKNITVIGLNGGHHFGRDYNTLAQMILKSANDPG